MQIKLNIKQKYGKLLNVANYMSFGYNGTLET